MSNYLAVATVTGALQHVLSSRGRGVPGAKVSTTTAGRSGAGGTRSGHQYFLYQVMPNGAYRNADLPTRRSNGQVVQRP